MAYKKFIGSTACGYSAHRSQYTCIGLYLFTILRPIDGIGPIHVYTMLLVARMHSLHALSFPNCTMLPFVVNMKMYIYTVFQKK